MKKQNKIKKFQQGDCLFKSTKVAKRDFGKKLNHLIVQQSDVSGNKHQCCEGDCILYEAKNKDEFYLEVKSDFAYIKHEEHKDIKLSKGKYFVYGVKEFDPFKEDIRRIRD